MKIFLNIWLILALFLAACTPYMYGVPQETWDRMSEPERIQAMGIYEREQQARRQAVEERARQKAFEREQKRVRQAEVARARQERIEAIHRGEGAYGELLRVRLQGGRIKVGDQHHRYEPITFSIADGETREIDVMDRKGRATPLVVTYSGGAVSFEGIRFPYDRSWGKGRLYTDTATSGALQMRGVDVFIEVNNRSSRHERERPRLVVIREEPPPVVVIRDKDGIKHPPVIATEKDKPNLQPVVTPDKPPLRPPLAQPPKHLAAALHPHTLEVVLLTGELKVQGKHHHLEKVTLQLVDGDSRNVAVKAGNESFNLSLQYHHGELLIDGDPARGHDVVRLPFEKEWNSGKIYRFDLKGRVALEKVEIKVRGIDGK